MKGLTCHALSAIILCMAHSAILRAEWGRRIRAARIQRGLTVFHLAQLAGIDPGGVSRIERGTQGVGDDMKIQFARALGVRVAEIFVFPDTTDGDASCSAASAEATAASPQSETPPPTPKSPRRRNPRRAPSATGPARSEAEDAPTGATREAAS